MGPRVPGPWSPDPLFIPTPGLKLIVFGGLYQKTHTNFSRVQLQFLTVTYIKTIMYSEK